MTPRILIAEDDQTLQMLYQMTIDSWGLPIKLRIVANGFDGLLQVGQQVAAVAIGRDLHTLAAQMLGQKFAVLGIVVNQGEGGGQHRDVYSARPWGMTRRMTVPNLETSMLIVYGPTPSSARIEQ